MLTPEDIEQIRTLIREELARAGIAPIAQPAPRPRRVTDRPELAAVRDRVARGSALVHELHATGDGVARLIALMSDRSDRERQLLAAEFGGKLGDDALVRVYQKLLADRGDPELRTAAFAGLFAMWAMPPTYGALSKAAYKATLEILKSVPRSGELTPGMLVEIRTIAMAIDEDWLHVATWFKAADVREVLARLVVGGAVDPFGCRVLVDTIVELGASRKELDKLRKQLADAELCAALDEAIARAT